MSSNTMPPKRGRPTANPRTVKTYLMLTSYIPRLIGAYDGGGDYAGRIITGLEDLVHYEFDVILAKKMPENAPWAADKELLLELLKKLRKWAALKHVSIWTGENYASAEKSPARQAVADSVKMTFYDMYSYILKTSHDIETDQPGLGAFGPRLSKRGRFVQDSEFDLFAKSEEVESAESIYAASAIIPNS